MDFNLVIFLIAVVLLVALLLAALLGADQEPIRNALCETIGC
ncbi:hypothetical protein [Bacillus marinisedimentorum]|nr:hypothetical protein [Bacillus marinisedimentorum]